MAVFNNKHWFLIALEARKSEIKAFGSWWESFSWFEQGYHLTVSSCSLLKMALFPFIRVLLSWPNYLLQSLLLNTIKLGTGASNCGFCEDTNIVYSRNGPLSALKPDLCNSFKIALLCLEKIFRKWDYFLKWKYFKGAQVTKNCNCIVVDMIQNSHHLSSPAMSPHSLDLLMVL